MFPQLIGYRFAGWNMRNTSVISHVFGSSCLCGCVPVCVGELADHKMTILFYIIQISEAGDPQLVAEPGVGRNHGEAMGKS